MADLIIRPVRLDDVEKIAAIYAEAVLTGTATFDIKPPTPADIDRRRIELERGGFPFLVAEAGTFLGYAYAGPYRLRPAYRFTVEDSVYVAAEARGRGIGAELLAALVETAAARGFRQMVAVIGGADNEASLRLHTKAGFEMIGTLRDVGWKHGRWLDTVLMQRPLGSGGTRPPDSLETR